jgi:hypothetical protein
VHVFGDLLANREYAHGQPDWLDIGFAITDIDVIVGGVILTLLQFWVLRRTRAGGPGAGRPRLRPSCRGSSWRGSSPQSC